LNYDSDRTNRLIIYFKEKYSAQCRTYCETLADSAPHEKGIFEVLDRDQFMAGQPPI
jgi:hypothetical protein